MKLRKLISIDNGLSDPPTKNKMVQEASDFLSNWYKNRKITDPYIDKAVRMDKPDWDKRSKNSPNVREVEYIDQNVNGRYFQNNIQLQSGNYDENTVLHEMTHYMDDIPTYSRTTDTEVIKNEIKSKENAKGIYNTKYDYFSNPEEIKARLMILRRAAGFKPDESVTPEMLKTYLESNSEQIENVQDLINMTESDDNLLNLLNFTADNSKVNKNLFYAEEGGMMDPPENYYKTLAMIESGNNPNAMAKTSSAAGLYQFTKGTWDSLVKDLGLNYTLEDRLDPVKSRKVVEEFTRRNEKSLKNKLGRNPNEAELYLAHFSGAGGARKLLDTIGTNPEAPVTDFVSKAALKANKNVFFNEDGSPKKAYEIYNWSAKKFGSPVLKPVEPEQPEKTAPQNVRERREVQKDNTRVRQPKRIPSLATTPTNPNYAALPDLKQEEEVTSKPVTEEQIRQLLSQERQAIESRFTEALRQQQVEDQPEEDYIPQLQDVSHLYNYINVDSYQYGGKKGCGGPGQPPCTPTKEEINQVNRFVDNTSKLYRKNELEMVPGQTANTWRNMFGNVGKYFFNIEDEDLKESLYRPTVNSDSNTKYYTRPGLKEEVFSDLTSTEVKKNYNHSGEFDDIYKGLKSNGEDREHKADTAFPKNKAGYKGLYNRGHGSFKGEFNLGRYKVDAGEDENGRYISFYDVYDWNGMQTDNKIPFYDRIYEKEWEEYKNKKN